MEFKLSRTLVDRLREVALEKSQEAWRRLDGGQDLSIGSMLAEEAAGRIEHLEAELAAAHRLYNEVTAFIKESTK